MVKRRDEKQQYFDHYAQQKRLKQTADEEELAKFYNNNQTIPIDVSKFDK
ncbi:hypothetical protein [Aquibacillus sediminis]|nr:hypothetical protein [Aquibacillus sediminis]